MSMLSKNLTARWLSALFLLGLVCSFQAACPWLWGWLWVSPSPRILRLARPLLSTGPPPLLRAPATRLFSRPATLHAGPADCDRHSPRVDGLAIARLAVSAPSWLALAAGWVIAGVAEAPPSSGGVWKIHAVVAASKTVKSWPRRCLTSLPQGVRLDFPLSGAKPGVFSRFKIIKSMQHYLEPNKDYRTDTLRHGG